MRTLPSAYLYITLMASCDKESKGQEGGDCAKMRCKTSRSHLQCDPKKAPRNESVGLIALDQRRCFGGRANDFVSKS